MSCFFWASVIISSNFFNFCKFSQTFQVLFLQGFGTEKDENHVDLCLRFIVFSFESSCL